MKCLERVPRAPVNGNGWMKKEQVREGTTEPLNNERAGIK